MGTARDEAEQGHRRLEAKCQTLHSICASEYSSAYVLLPFLLLCLVVNQLLSSGLHARALPDQEEKVAMDQKVHEMGDQLAVLTASGWVLYDVVLSAARGLPQLALRLDEARL